MAAYSERLKHFIELSVNTGQFFPLDSSLNSNEFFISLLITTHLGLHFVIKVLCVLPDLIFELNVNFLQRKIRNLTTGFLPGNRIYMLPVKKDRVPKFPR